MNLDIIIDFIKSTFGIPFLMQYLGGKALDKTFSYMQNVFSEEEKRFEFFSKTLEVLCKKMGWEFDENAVRRELEKEDFVPNDFMDEKNADRILCKLLGKDYKEYYDSDIESRWKECIIQCIKMPQFEMIYKDFCIDKIDDLQNGQRQILDEIKKIKINQGDIKEEWKRKEDLLINENNINDFKNAIEDIENKDYESAIDKLKKVNYWADEGTKVISFFKIGFCYSQLHRYEEALRWFLKAEKKCDDQRDDVVILFRNIALTYIYIGKKENKIDNYNKSNEYFKKVLSYMKETDMLYYYEALIHIATNYMDMCDEVPVNDVPDYLEIAEYIILYICCCDCKLTVELTYVLVHNAARLFFQKAEKIDDKYMKTAQQLYKYVLDMDYVKENKELLAMLNINAGMAFQYDENDKFENAKKALAYYECGKDLYESIDEVNYQSEIANAELDIAAAYKTIYHFTGDEKDFRKCLDLTNGIIGKIKYSPKNSLLLRTYLMQLYLYLEAVKCGQTPSGLIDLEHVRNKLSIMSSQINYEKYKYTYQLLICEIDLLLLKEMDYDKLNSIKSELIRIQNATKTGNKNIYDKAGELFKEYENLLSADQQIKY